MDDGDRTNPGPPLETIEAVFAVTDREVADGTLRYYGAPRVPPEPLLSELWPAFHEAGYELHLERRRVDESTRDGPITVHDGELSPERVGNGGTTRRGGYVLVAEPAELGIDGIPWTNVVLFLATVLSTLFVGTQWYYVDPFGDPVGATLEAWPFAAAILVVLGVHEMGHYVMSRYHRVQASLPYFLPVPTLIGTMGAVIKMKGRMPDRKALFDIGVAGPIAGLVATVAVTIVGLHLEPVTAPQSVANDPDAVEIRLGYPPMLELLAAAFDQPLYRDDPTTSINPVVVGGWVGMFITFLNLIPVGQLDGGHVLRAMVGSLQETVAALVPAVLFSFAAYLYYVGGYAGTSVSVWAIWGVFAILLAAAGPANPVDDTELGRGRIALGIVTFVLGALCFIPVPVEIIE